MSRRALGRGLRALISEGGSAAGQLDARQVPVKAIVPNRFQPRLDPQDSSIDELAESIRQHGVLEPVIVRPLAKGYELVVGERRWRAATLAGLESIPAVVRDMSDRESIAVALVENLQREQLDPIEEARGFKRLMELFDVTQEELAAEIGRSRSSVANSLRLLTLEEEIQEMLRAKKISVGHAKVLLGLPPGEARVELARQVAEGGLSVRETEALVQGQGETRKPVRKATTARRKVDPSIRSLEERLESALGTKVRVTHRARGGGKIEIEYYNDDDVARIVEVIAPGASIGF